LAPSAFPNCLGDTHLKPFHLCFDAGPACLFPHLCSGRGRTSNRYLRIGRRHLLLLAQRLFKTLSPCMTSRKSARFRVAQCFSSCPVHYSRSFAFSAFLYPPHLRRSLRFACRCAAA